MGSHEIELQYWEPEIAGRDIYRLVRLAGFAGKLAKKGFLENISHEYFEILHEMPVIAPEGLSIIAAAKEGHDTFLIGVRNDNDQYDTVMIKPTENPLPPSENIRKNRFGSPVFVGKTLEVSREDGLMFLYNDDRSMRAFCDPAIDEVHLIEKQSAYKNLEQY